MQDEQTPAKDPAPAESVQTPPANSEQKEEAKEPEKAAPRNTDARTFRIRRGGGRGRGGPRRRSDRDDLPQSDYEEKTLEISRVTRVTKGGKRMRFRALSIVGNRKGRVGFGMGKGVDVAQTTTKAFAQARKNLITVPIVNETIPHEVHAKFSAAKILMKPAPRGSGVKAGGAVRQVLELAGIPNVSAKILGSGNKVNNVKATFLALRALRQVKEESEKNSKKEKTESKEQSKTEKSV